MLDERDLRIALNWVAHDLYAKARSPLIPKVTNSPIFLHIFTTDLETPYGKKIHVEVSVKVSPKNIAEFLQPGL